MEAADDGVERAGSCLRKSLAGLSAIALILWKGMGDAVAVEQLATVRTCV